MARRQIYRVNLSGGLYRFTNESILPEGLFERLNNYVPEPDGTLRSRIRWEYPTQTGSAIPNGGASVHWCGLETSPRGVYVARRGASDTTIHKADDETTPAWGSAVIDTLSGADFHVPFVTANGIVLYGNFTFPNDRLRFFNGTTAADASTVAVAGRSVTYHKERFWSAAPEADPTGLYYSGVSDHTSWNLANKIDVGRNDGGVIEDIAPALGGLLIAKTNSLWFLSGDGPNTFALTRLDGGEGVWGRCICPILSGAFIVGNRDMYLWRGGPVERISQPLGGLYSTPGWVTTALLGSEVFVCPNDFGTMFVYDLDRKFWRQENSANDPGEAINAITLGGGDLTTLIGIASEGENAAVDGIRTRALYGSRLKDAVNRGMFYEFQTGRISPGGLARKFTVLRWHALINQRGSGTGNFAMGLHKQVTGGGGTPIGEVLNLDGSDGPGIHRYTMSGEADAIDKGLFVNGFEFIDSGSSETVIFDPIAVEIEYDIEEGWD